jgi:acyl carrier protein
MTHVEETIRNYIQSSFLADGQPAVSGNGDSDGGLSSNDDLFTILDSLQILRMLLDLEAEHAIKVENSELTPDNLGTISRLANFITRKRQEAACQELPT